ncbi:MAG: carboxylating nicotinate-nucleotide diphosphorylase [Nitrospirae bacterium]|nr:carboxylating nicotinate-nucleotide diphosphorylase [Nitrospirota bacterium]
MTLRDEIPAIELEAFLRQALREDLGFGDLTTRVLFGEHRRVKGFFLAKEDLVLAGLDLIEMTCRLLDPVCQVNSPWQDGARVPNGESIAEVACDAQALLTGERVILNLLQHLSGIATLTVRYVEAVRGTHARILDTRKTTPGLRKLEKYAVRVGGGYNHRFGLSDGILIKDNHLVLMGSIKEAIDRARKHAPPLMKIEVEARTLHDVQDALDAKADVIMLDNMDLPTIQQAVEFIGKRARVEVSGRVTLDRVRAIAETGVDYISVGSLTHSAKAVDISFEILP